MSCVGYDKMTCSGSDEKLTSGSLTQKRLPRTTPIENLYGLTLRPKVKGVSIVEYAVDVDLYAKRMPG